MNKIVNVTLMGGFNGCKPYMFYTDLELAVGEKVVCDTVNGLIVGEVKSFEKEPTANDNIKPTKWVVSKIDMGVHNRRIEREKLRQEKMREMAKVKKEMDARISEIMDIKMYEKYADSDATMKELLDKFKELSKEE